jgi:flagellar and swarming motility FlbD protein
VITLVTGEKIVVRENVEQILERILQFRRSVLSGIFPGWDNQMALSPPSGSGGGDSAR